MKNSQTLMRSQIQKIVEKVIFNWKQQAVITFKEDEKKVIESAIQAVLDDYQKELDLDKEVHAMLDKLERSNSGEFQRFKMYPLLKQKLAKEKKVVL
jgi:hypothetical protein